MFLSFFLLFFLFLFLLSCFPPFFSFCFFLCSLSVFPLPFARFLLRLQLLLWRSHFYKFSHVLFMFLEFKKNRNFRLGRCGIRFSGPRAHDELESLRRYFVFYLFQHSNKRIYFSINTPQKCQIQKVCPKMLCNRALETNSQRERRGPSDKRKGKTKKQMEKNR